MRMFEYVNKVSRSRVSVNADRWQSLKQYYMSMYHFYMLKMYDKGYISDPTVFDEKELRRNIVDNGITDFKDDCGKLVLSSEYALFALHRNKHDEDSKEYLELLYQVLRYYEYCIELDKQYELCQSHLKLNFAVKSCSNLTTLSDINYNKGVFTALLKDGYVLEEAWDIRELVFDLAMDELGIPKSDYCDGMLMNGLTHEEEVYFAQLILDGGVLPDGVYANKLYTWLKDNKWTAGSYYNANNKGLYSYIHGTRDTAIFEEFTRLYDKYDDRLVIFYEDVFYLKKPMSYYNMPISFFVSLTTGSSDDTLIDSYNTFYGYNGEAYSYDYLIQEGLEAVGIPLVVNISGIETQVYDTSQLVRKTPIEGTWFKSYDVLFEFDESYSEPNPYNPGTLEYDLFEAYIAGMRGEIYKVPAPVHGFKDIKTARKKVIKEVLKLV